MFTLSMRLDNTEGAKAGDYTVNKIFDVAKPKVKPSAINGIVVQKVIKTTNVNVDDGRHFNTTAEIKKYTCGNVNFACDSYLEYFVIRGGTLFPKTITDGFAGGAIAQYEKDDEAPENYDAIFDDEDPSYITSGNVVHIGDSVFISDEAKAEIEALPWIRDAEAEVKPSNGLPYLNTSYWDAILKKRQSNILTHTVNVTWADSGDSKITSTTKTAGGKRQHSKRQHSKRQSSKRQSKRRTMKL